MADTSAEDAFLRSMQSEANGDYSTTQYTLRQPQNAEDDEEEDYDPSSLMPETSYSSNTAEQPGAAGSTVSGSMVQSPARTASRASNKSEKPAETAAPAKQPRTVGGFVVDDEDDEDEEPIAKPKVAGSNGLLNVARGSSNTPQRSLSQTPNNTLPHQDVSIHRAAQDQGVSGVVPSGATDTASNLAPAVSSDTATPAQEDVSAKPSQIVPGPSERSTATPASVQPVAMAAAKGRLPHDKIGILEDRIAEDPRGDLDAWLNLISENRKRNKIEYARAVYERFLKVFPSAAEIWVALANMELENNDFHQVELIFSKTLLTIPNVQLWSLYLDYVRRRNDLSDPTGNARQIVSQAYDFVLQNVGMDKDSGQIWQDYVSFVRSGPGNIGGSGWQDQQKMDLLRKAYQRAIIVPTPQVMNLWKQYDSFEMGLNKATGRKFLQERSPGYMNARSAIVELENITRNLKRTTLPRLPPALGFDGDTEYAEQVSIWNHWINWEKDDPLGIKDEDPITYRNRILYVYKQAVMALRFWPELWYDAAEWCFQNNLETEGNDFLSQGLAANPESCLLAFKRADRIELTIPSEEGEESLKRRGDAVREPYDKLLDALYDLINKTKSREIQAVARIREHFAQQSEDSGNGNDDEYDEEQPDRDASSAKEAAMRTQIDAIQKGNAVQIRLLSKTISYAWIALMRAMRRVQGKGKPGSVIGGFRQVFADARKRGRITSDVYVTSALIEYHCYKDPAATKIFERGMKLFPEDEEFALEYLKHLIAINDITNARAVFETTVSKLAQKPETLQKAKPIYAFFHEYESHYGELSQISKLEKRMSDLFPDDPQLTRFSHRYSSPGFDPTAIRPIVSPASQARPKMLVPPPIVEQPAPSVQGSPRPTIAQIANSPKRPFVPDESDNDIAQPRKIARAESPLKGAAGRRLDAQRRNQQGVGASNLSISHVPPPTPLPREINFLLGIIPPSHTYHATVFSAEKMVQLIRGVDLNRASLSQNRTPQPPAPQPGYGQIPGGFVYNR